MSPKNEFFQRLLERMLASKLTKTYKVALQAMALEEPKRARLVADYIAGMTDRYALREYKNFFGIKVFEE